MQYKLTVVILTYNEEIHIERAIRNVLNWADKIIVLDSYSQDRTVDLAKTLGAEVISRKFDDYKNQRQFAIDYCKNLTEWMLFLDADEYLLDALKDEILIKLKSTVDVAGYYLCRRAIFMGKWIRYGGYYPTYILRLFKPQLARLDEAVNEHVMVSGQTAKLRHDFVDRNLKDISFWLDKHNRYTSLGARDLILLREKKINKAKNLRFTVQAERKRWIRENIWDRFPLLIRPFIYFFYRYVIRLGFLDGRVGFIYHFLQGGLNYFLIDVKFLEEKMHQRRS